MTTIKKRGRKAAPRAQRKPLASGKIDVARLKQQLAEARAQQAATAAILKVIARSPSDAQPVFDTIVKSALRLIGGNAAVVTRVVGEMRHLAAFTTTSKRGDEALKSYFPGPISRGLVGKAIEAREPMFISDTETDSRVNPEYRKLARTRGIRSVILTPMLRGKAVIGTINVNRSEPGLFTAHHVNLLKSFADQAVIAIENARLFNETKEALERQTATAAILKVIASSPSDVQPVFDAIARSALQLIGSQSAVVTRLVDDTLHLAARTATSKSGDKALRSMFPMPVSGSVGTAGRAIKTGAPVYVSDTETDPGYGPKYRKLARARGFRSVMTVPMLREKRAIGTIAVTRRQPGAFTVQQIGLLQTFADQAVIAIENVRLFNETKESLERQTATAEILKVIASSPSDVQPVFDAIAESAARICGADDVLIFRVEGANLRSVAHFGDLRPSRPLGSTYDIRNDQAIGRAVLEHRTIHIRDAAAEYPRDYPGAVASQQQVGYRTYLIVPLMREGAAIGLIGMRRLEVQPFSDKQVALLQTFADQAVIAIENVRLFNETKEALERQTATAEILKVIAGSPSDVQPVFDAIVGNALRLMAGSTAHVTRLEGDTLHLLAFSATDAEGEAALKRLYPLKIAGTPTAEALATQRARITSDAETDPQISDEVRAVMRARGVRSHIRMHMVSRGESIGTIVVNRKHAGPFPPHEIELLKTFADQAVIAIENVRLFNETKEALERQTATTEILNVISRSPTGVQPVFDAIVESAARLFNCNASIQMLGDRQIHLRAAAGPGAAEGLLERTQKLFPIPYEPDRYIIASVIAKGETREVLDTDAPEIPELMKKIARAAKFRSLTLVPMLRDGVGIGAIALNSKEPGFSLNDKQRALLQVFANQAVIAIENVRLFNETKEALERQTATAEILRVIASSPSDVQPVFDTIARNAVALCGCLYANVFQFDGELLHWVASHGLDGSGRDALARKYPMRPDLSQLSGRAMLAKSLVHTDDTRSDPDYDPALAAKWARRMLAAPMLRDGNQAGAIVVGWADPGTTPIVQQELLKTFADQAVIAIENVRLFNETKEALERQTATSEVLRVIGSSVTDIQPVFDIIAERAARLTGAGYGWVFRFDGEWIHVASSFGVNAQGVEAALKAFPMRPSGGSVTARAVRDGVVVNVADVLAEPDSEYMVKQIAEQAGYRSVLSVPMLRDQHIVGAISVARSEAAVFADKEVDLLSTFASQAVIAIENVRLFNETKEALERQTATADVLRVISSSPTNLEPVYRTILESITRLCESQIGALFLYDGEHLITAASHGTTAEFAAILERARPRPSRQTTTRLAALERRTVHVADLLSDPEFSPTPRDLYERENVRTVLSVPMLRENTLIGVITTWRRQVRPFGDRQVGLVQSFADQAVIAIENVRLFNETREALEQQTATAEILQVISGSPTDVQPVLDAIVHSGAQLFPPCNAVILMRENELLHLRAFTGPNLRNIEEVTALFPIPFDPKNIVAAQAMEERRIIQIPDTEQVGDIHAIAKAVARASGYRSLTMVPLIREGQGIGTIALTHPEPGFLMTEKQLALVQTFASQAVIAIENVRLFNETKEALERQTATAEVLQVISGSMSDAAPVFAAILESSERLIADAAGSSINLIGDDGLVHAGYFRFSPMGRAAFPTPADADEAEQRMRTRGPVPLAGSMTELAIRAGRALTFADVLHGADVPESLRAAARAIFGGEQSYALASVPLLKDGRGLGTISVGRQRLGEFSDKELSLLKTFADQAVVAIENARLFNETKEALERQTATAGILKVISESPTDVHPVFAAIVQSAARLFAPCATGIHTLEGDRIYLQAVEGPLSSEEKFKEVVARIYPLPFDPGHNMASRTIAERKIIEVPDTEAPDVPAPVAAMGRASGTRSITQVPLIREGVGIGTIGLNHPMPGFRFNEKQKALLQTFADQAVIAIENVRLFNETREALERQTATAEILQVIASSPSDVKPVFEAILQAAVRLCDTPLAAIFRYDGKLLHLEATENWPPEAISVKNRYPAEPDPGQTSGRVILNADIVRQEDTLADPTYDRSAAAAGGWRRMLGVPMLKERAPIGAIVVAWPEPGKIPEKQVALLKTFADQAVIAIENVRLFNETKEALERQTATAEILKVISGSPADTQPVFDAIVQSADRLFGRKTALRLVEPDGLRRRAWSYTMGDEFHGAEILPVDRDNLVGRAVLECKALQVADLHGPDATPYSRAHADQLSFRSVATAPLIRDGVAIGVITMSSPNPGAMSDKQMALLATFADQAVIAIENVRLFNETKEALERQTATAEILQVISSSPTDVQPVFDAVVQSAARMLAPASVALNIREGDLIRLHGMAGPAITDEVRRYLEGMYPIAFDPQISPAARSMAEGKVLEVPDVQSPDTPPRIAAMGRAIGFRSNTQIPLLREGEGIGALSVAHPQAGFTLGEKRLTLMQTFAAQAVIAIENVRLFKELQQRIEQMTALREVGQAISSTLDLETVLKTIVQRAVQLTGLDAGSIYEFDAGSASFHLRAALNMPEELVETYRRMPIRLGEGIVGSAAATRAPVQVPDIEDASYQTRYKEMLLRQGYRAILAVPLAREEQVIGAITVSRNSPGEFAPEVVELLKTFASQSALAIQNARLFREIAEKGRQLEEASQHKSQFLASMSHELRTPLNAILGFNEMILDQVYGEVSEDVKAPLENMQSSGKHLLRLINNVLDLAKIEAGRMELALSDYSVHDTVASVHSTLKPLAADKGLEFLASVPDDVPLAYGDGGRIAQCLMNLAGNSLKFTKAGKVEISVEQKDGLLRYSVADTGIGIPQEKIASLFTEFKQSDATIASEYGGTGLGLSISKKFIEMHGGRIWVESEPGKGSTFLFEIPLRVAS